MATLSVRELYAPSHFGNTYEATLPGEMSALLAEARFWGFNRFADWFDTIDLYNVYEKKHKLFNMPEAIWARKFSNYQAAASQGLDLGLVVTPNHVFSDQVTPQNEAVKTDGHIFGQLVCPHRPGVAEMVLNNYRRLFHDFTDRGLRLAGISGGAYDYGGCACDACKPWIVTFGKLFKQIAELAGQFFGDISVELWGWWWSDDDHQTFTDWANAEGPGFFKAMAYHLPYGTTDYAARPIPAGCAERAFVHIGYGEGLGGRRDPYCHYGANIAPIRLEKTIRYLMSRNADGFLAYSEGDHDDINKAVSAGLASGQFNSADEILRAYALRHFGCEPAGWSELLGLMGDFETMDTQRCRSLFDRLASSARPSWRLWQIDGRLKMAEAHRAVLALTDWNADRVAAAERFLAAKEHLYRNVWRLGLQRHAFKFDSYLPKWYPEYVATRGRQHQQSQAERNVQT